MEQLDFLILLSMVHDVSILFWWNHSLWNCIHKWSKLSCEFKLSWDLVIWSKTARGKWMVLRIDCLPGTTQLMHIGTQRLWQYLQDLQRSRPNRIPLDFTEEKRFLLCKLITIWDCFFIGNGNLYPIHFSALQYYLSRTYACIVHAVSVPVN